MNAQINRENPLKLYLQLSDILKKRIENGEWRIGSLIPTEDALCRTYDVSRATVRGATSELTRDGYLSKQQGKGTFVIKKVVADRLTMMTNFDETIVEQPENIQTSILAQTIMMPVDDLAERLDISPEKHLIYIKRVRTVNDITILIQESYVPLHLCPHLLKEDLESISLFEFFEKRAGLHITHLNNNFEITLLNAEEGRLFEYPVRTPALVLTQQFYSAGINIMFCRSVKRPGKTGFSLQFDRKAI